MKKSEIKNSAQLFLYKAIVDFNSAKCLYEVFMVGEIELDLEKIYFDLQQCAEKLLKSLLTNSGIIIPKTHDIEMLIKLLDNNSIQYFEDIEVLKNLTDYAVEGRYSIVCDDIDDVQRYIEILEKLRVSVENLVMEPK